MMWALLLSLVSGSGCGKDSSFTPGALHSRSIDVTDSNPILGTHKREYLVAAPTEVKSNPAPVTFVFHGQYDTPEAAAERHQHLQKLSDADGGIIVYPRGLGDGDSGTGWNVGAHGDSSSCNAGHTDGASCYQSCSAISACGPCDWSTCVDDNKFVQSMIQDLDDSACIDKSKMYIYGESNGGMMVYSLLQQMPGVFAAAVPEQGLPLVGYPPSFLEAEHTTSVFHRHDRQDRTVPLDGSVSDDGWKYITMDSTLKDYCNAADKSAEPVAKATEWDSPLKTLSFGCSEYQGCSSGKNVVHCMYNGQHGDLPEDKSRHDDTMIWKFLSMHSLPASTTTASFLDVNKVGTLLTKGTVRHILTYEEDSKDKDHDKDKDNFIAPSLDGTFFFYKGGVTHGM